MDSDTPKDHHSLAEFARRRLKKLAEIGLSKPSDHPHSAGNTATPTQFVGGRRGWLQLGAGERPEDGRTEIRITYRFGPPPGEGYSDGSAGGENDSSVVSLQNGREFCTSPTNALTLTIVAVK